MSGPLNGYRVLDCTDEFGAYGTRLLADLGADVVRLEPPAGDPMRLYPPFLAEDGKTSLYYAHFNLGKRAVAFDWESPEGQEELRALIRSCNVLVESAPPDRLISSRLGLDELRRWRPDLTLISITPFGLSGPYRDYVGGDLQVVAQSGLLYLRAGDPNGRPFRPGAEQACHMTSLLAANAALLGLFEQQARGRPSRVEVAANFATSLATLQSGNANFFTWKGLTPKSRGAIYQVRETADGWTTYTASLRPWDGLLTFLKRHGVGDEFDSPEYQQLEYRQAHAQEIHERVTALLKTMKKQEVFEEAQALGLHYMPVNTVADLTRDSFLMDRQFFRDVEWPALNWKLTFPGAPFHFDGRDPAEPLPPPGHAEHNEAILNGLDRSPPRQAISRSESDEETSWLPLKGVRVLDFAWLIAGPLGTRLLSNFGAEVLKIESYHRVDGIRLTGPHPESTTPPNVNTDGSFNDVNLGKKSILLNLNVPEAREIALRLAAVSDIVTANFTGDRLDRWGLGFEDLRRVKKDIIFMSMPVFDSKGPRRRWGGVGSDVAAISGINSISGFEGTPLHGLGLHYPDFGSNPFHAQAAILSALVSRERFKEAQFIEVSQYESTVSLLGPALVTYFANGAEPKRLGNRSDRYCPHNTYRCQGTDQWCAISASNEQEWRSLCLALGHEEWLSDPRFATLEARRLNEDALDQAIGEAVGGWDARQLALHLQHAKVPAAPMNHVGDLLADPWYREQYFTEMAGPEDTVFASHGEPLSPFGRKHAVTRAPMMGEHTEEVLRSLLGLKDEEMNDLYLKGALG
jgi:crotonobetainyl-CoA:carnitine CoA-transferase CaiB-like acyl-CoA transferase